MSRDRSSQPINLPTTQWDCAPSLLSFDELSLTTISDVAEGLSDMRVSVDCLGYLLQKFELREDVDREQIHELCIDQNPVQVDFIQEVVLSKCDAESMDDRRREHSGAQQLCLSGLAVDSPELSMTVTSDVFGPSPIESGSLALRWDCARGTGNQAVSRGWRVVSSVYEQIDGLTGLPMSLDGLDVVSSLRSGPDVLGVYDVDSVAGSCTLLTESLAESSELDGFFDPVHELTTLFIPSCHMFPAQRIDEIAEVLELETDGIQVLDIRSEEVGLGDDRRELLLADEILRRIAHSGDLDELEPEVDAVIVSFTDTGILFPVFAESERLEIAVQIFNLHKQIGVDLNTPVSRESIAPVSLTVDLLPLRRLNIILENLGIEYTDELIEGAIRCVRDSSKLKSNDLISQMKDGSQEQKFTVTHEIRVSRAEVEITPTFNIELLDDRRIGAKVMVQWSNNTSPKRLQAKVVLNETEQNWEHIDRLATALEIASPTTEHLQHAATFETPTTCLLDGGRVTLEFRQRIPDWLPIDGAID